MLKLIYLFGFSLCVLVSSNPAYQRIPVWGYPQNGCQHNQNQIPNVPLLIKPQSPSKGPDIKTVLTQEVVDKILENPVISAIISQSGNEVKKPESSVINNYIIVPSEFLKLNDSINKIVSQDNQYKFLQANTKNCKATTSRTKPKPAEYRNNNSNRIPQQMPQYQRLQEPRRPFEPNRYCPNNYQSCGCNYCDNRRNMQCQRPNEQQRGKPNQQKSVRFPNGRAKVKVTQSKPKEQRRGSKVTEAQKNSKLTESNKNKCLSNFDVELFEDLGNIYDPKPIQRHCQSVDDTNCIRDEETLGKNNEKPVNKVKPSQKNNSRKQNSSNKSKTTSKDEAIIKNFMRKFPNIPEEVIRKVVHDVKKQLSESNKRSRTKSKDQQTIAHQHRNSQNNTNRKDSKQEVWQPPYYSTRPYESKKSKPTFSLARHSKENTKGIRNDNSREGIPNDNKTVTQRTKLTEKSKDNKHHDFVPSTKTELVSNDNIESTTKSPTTFETTTQIDSTTNALPTTIKLDETTTKSPVSFEDGIKYPELGAEDVVLQVPNIIDDYFPNFQIDNKAHSLKDDDIFENDYFESFYQEDSYKTISNNEVTSKYLDKNEVTSRSLGNNDVTSRYLGNNEVTSRSDDYITTTPNYRKAKERFDIPFDSYSDEYPEESAEIKFQTPPGLDKPNFLSKKINPKILLNTEELNIYTEDYHYKTLNEAIGEQLSRYNTNFASNSRDIEDILNEIQKEGFRENKNGKVETVYARSKVMNYGNDNKENIETLFDETTQATIVLARSYPEDEFW